MSDSARPAQYYVTELPSQHISDFGEHSKTSEAVLILFILGASASPAPAIVVRGPVSTGKPTSFVGVGHAISVISEYCGASWVPFGLSRRARMLTQ